MDLVDTYGHIICGKSAGGVPIRKDKNISAAVIAVVSLREISRIMAETRPANEKDLWESGLPIIFVVFHQPFIRTSPLNQIICK